MTTIIGIEPGESLLCVECHDRLPLIGQDECANCFGDEQHWGTCFHCGHDGPLAVFPDGEYDSDGALRDCSTRICLRCGSKDVGETCDCNEYGDADDRCRQWRPPARDEDGKRVAQ